MSSQDITARAAPRTQRRLPPEVNILLVLVGIAVYYMAEVPMMKFFRRVRSSGQAGAPVPASAASR